MSTDDARPPTPLSGVLSGLRLDELLGEVQQRLAEIVATRDRLQRLLDAVLAVATGLQLESTLRSIVQAAVVREAVSNAVWHGRPSAVVLTVEAGAELVIDVFDDGVGIDPDRARSGLRTSEQQAAACAGALSVRAEPAGGTRLVWRVPLG